MANRFPLIANQTVDQIQEIPSGDFLDLSNSGIANSGNILVSGIVSASGNIAGSFIIGNGSQLTGLPSGYSNADVATYLSSGTVTTAILTTGNISASGNITGLNINSSNADLAEMYVADADYAAGTVVEFGGDFEITAANQSHTSRVAGIVSTAPSYLMNTAQAGEHVLPVALIGRVPCQVVGSITKGDCLVASHVKGTAQRLDPAQYQPACIVGKALENYSSDQIGTIEVAVGRT